MLVLGRILAVGPRDGLQNEAVSLSSTAKLDLIAQAVSARTRRIEVTSVVDPRLVPQMSDAPAVLAGLPADPARIEGKSPAPYLTDPDHRTIIAGRATSLLADPPPLDMLVDCWKPA